MFTLLRNWINRYLADPQLVILGVLLLFGFTLVFWLGEMLVPVFIAVIIAYLLDGVVGWLRRHHMPRLIAVGLVFVGFIVCLILLLVWLLPLLSRQVAQFVQDLPSMLQSGQELLLLLPERYPEAISAAQINRILEHLSTGLTRLGEQAVSLSLASVRGIIMFFVYLILVPLMVFFFLKDKTLILGWIKGFLPEHRTLAAGVWEEVNAQIINYVRGKLYEILIIWLISYVTFTMLDLPFALLVSFFTGLSVLIPYIGVTVMTFPVMLVAYFQWGIGHEFFYAIGAYGVIQLFDGNLLAPLLLSEVVDLHPVAIIVAVLVFGGLWGLWGFFLAIPLATLVQAVVKAWFSSQTRDTPQG
ncbi:MAG: AI-2E family transporter [Desulfobacteraceae bacterium]|jgi:putative permease|nr:AI-2E family transporter [Desulfobacteraceae bacterium]